MERELNPQLFNLSHQQSLPPQTSVEVAFNREFKQLRDRLLQLEDRLTEFMKTMNLKSERMPVKIKSLESRWEGFLEDFQKKYSILMGKVSERTQMTAKIQELIDSHMHLMQTMESKVNQMQKMIDEQQMRIFRASADLEEARKEIVRLKHLPA